MLSGTVSVITGWEAEKENAMKEGPCPYEVIFLTSPDSKQNLRVGGGGRTLRSPIRRNCRRSPKSEVVAEPK